MKIFFTGSPRALKLFRKEHEALYKSFETLGHKHLSKLVVDADPEDFYLSDHERIVNHYNETIDNLKKADIVVAEISTHSMSMGYLVEKALGLGKPTIVFHLPEYPPFFFSGIDDDKLQIVEYTTETAIDVVKDAVDYAMSQQDVRFNFFISPAIGNYLDWISKVKKIPRSVYLRNLIEKDMEDNDEYNS